MACKQFFVLCKPEHFIQNGLSHFNNWRYSILAFKQVYVFGFFCFEIAESVGFLIGRRNHLIEPKLSFSPARPLNNKQIRVPSGGISCIISHTSKIVVRHKFKGAPEFMGKI
jgi:hypothetical protein